MPIANATISTGTSNYKTLRNGAFLFMTQPGSYTISAAATAYQTKSLSGVSVTPGKVLDASMSLAAVSVPSPTTIGNCKVTQDCCTSEPPDYSMLYQKKSIGLVLLLSTN